LKTWFLALFFLGIPLDSPAFDLNGTWVLKKSEISYLVTHPLHHVSGKSLSAKGKGVCYKGNFQFLVAVPVKSFDSGDNNRDLHMMEVTRAGTYPMVVVKVQVLPNDPEPTAPTELFVNATVDFAGQEAVYQKVKLEVLDWTEGGVHLKGILPITLKDFDIQPPSLLGIPIQNDVPVSLDMIWQRENSHVSQVDKK
jgi:hypothetical protein